MKKILVILFSLSLFLSAQNVGIKTPGLEFRQHSTSYMVPGITFGFGSRWIGEPNIPASRIYSDSIWAYRAYITKLTVDDPTFLNPVERFLANEVVSDGGSFGSTGITFSDVDNYLFYKTTRYPLSERGSYTESTVLDTLPLFPQVYSDAYMVSASEKQSVIFIRQDDSRNITNNRSRALFSSYGILVENGLNEGDNIYPYGSYWNETSDSARIAQRKALRNWAQHGQTFADHTPHHFTFIGPRLRDPYWDGSDDGYHYITGDFVGAWHDSLYAPPIDTMWVYPWTADSTATNFGDIQSIGYFNLSEAAKTWIRTIDDAEWDSVTTGNANTATAYDTVFFVAANYDVGGTTFKEYIYANYSDFDSTYYYALFKGIEPIRQFLIDGKKVCQDSIGIDPHFWIHPGSSSSGPDADIEPAAKWRANMLPGGGKVYDILTGTHQFDLPSLGWSHIDSATARQHAGYNMPIDALNYSLANHTYDESITMAGLQAQQTEIADAMKKNKIVCLILHNVLDYTTTDSLLSWIRYNGWPIVTAQEAAQFMTAKTNAYTNIIPNMSDDKDGNDIWDGWEWSDLTPAAAACTTDADLYDAIADSNCIELTGDRVGYVYTARVEDLFGVEKCRNQLSVWAKNISGTTNISIRIDETIWDDSAGRFTDGPETEFSWAIDGSWTQYTDTFIPDKRTAYIDIRVLGENGNQCRFAGVELRKEY